MLSDCANEQCGISNVFADMNEGKPLKFTQDFEEKELYFCCPAEATLDPFSWSKWKRVAKGVDEFGEVEFNEQWAPHTGTRREFLYEYQEALENYIAHKGHINSFNWNWKRAEHKLLIEPALTGIDPVGGNAAMGGCDWASTVDHMRAFTMTCK